MLNRVTIFVLAAGLLQAASAQTPRNILVKVHPPLGGSILQVLALDLDFTENVEEGVLEAVVSPDELTRIEAQGFRTQVVVPDLQASYQAGFDQGTALGMDLGSMGGYFTYTEIENKLNEFRTNYPNLISAPFSIGNTLEGRPTWTVRISNNPNVMVDRQRVYFDAMHHAREPLGMMCQIYFIEHLLQSYGSDPLVTELLNNREIYCTPCANPDGYVWNQTTNPGGGGLWRKNRRNNGGSFGVDLNRNYGHQWGFDNSGSSPTPTSETYRGPAAWSEPETVNNRDFIASLGSRLGVWLSNHTYGKLWLWPWGYTSTLAPRHPLYLGLSADFTADNQHTAGNTWATIYPANGVTADHGEGDLGVFSGTYEIGTSFWPATIDILPSCQVMLKAHLKSASVAGAYLERTALSVLDGGNANGRFDPGETGQVTFTVRNKGLINTPAACVASLVSTSAYAVPGGSVNLGVINTQTDANNNASPLTFTVPDFAIPGFRVGLTLRITTGDMTFTEDLSFVIGTPQAVFTDNFESNLGWVVGAPGDNATSGIWVRLDPNPTTYYSPTWFANPGDDASPAGVNCFVTGNSTSTNYRNADVDNGRTSLTSPVFDLSGKRWSWIEWQGWYADLGPNDDTLQVSLSNDGGANFLPAWSSNKNENRWVRREIRVRDTLRNTANCQFRIAASDAPENSAVEAAIDEFAVNWYDDGVSLSTTGTPGLGQTVTFNVTSSRDGGQTYAMGASFSTSPGIPLGEGRVLELTPDTLFFLAYGLPAIFQNWVGVLNGAGQPVAAPALFILNAPALVGITMHFGFVTLNPLAPLGIENFSDPVSLTVVP